MLNHKMAYIDSKGYFIYRGSNNVPVIVTGIRPDPWGQREISSIVELKSRSNKLTIKPKLVDEIEKHLFWS